MSFDFQQQLALEDAANEAARAAIEAREQIWREQPTQPADEANAAAWRNLFHE